jgi:multicomponent Na+:H+ antiporter subunit G
MTALMVVVGVLLALGLLFFLAAAVGLLRLPDCYTRAHATGKCDSLGALLSLTALALYHLAAPGHADHGVTFTILTSAKILLLAGFIYLTAPAATHAIFRSAHLTRLQPWTRTSKEREP